MLSNQMEPQPMQCPNCGGKLSEIIYGLPSGPPENGEIFGGCLIDDDSPTYACSKCGWDEGSIGKVFGRQSREVPKSFFEHEAVFGYYDKDLIQIVQVAHFLSQGSHHMFLFLRPGFSEWESAFTLEEFNEAMSQVQNASIEIWAIETPDDAPPEVFDVEPSNYGSSAIQACIDGAEIAETELLNEAKKIMEPTYWPNWFDPELMVDSW